MASAYDSKVVKEFLEAQYGLMHNMVSRAPGKTAKNLINKRTKESPESGEEGLAYIIEKKPPPKKVMKFIQGLIDEIVAENDM